MQGVPCHIVKNSRGASVLVKGNLERWASDKGLTWRTFANGEKRLYDGRLRCTIEQVSEETLLAMQYIFGKDSYDPTTV